MRSSSFLCTFALFLLSVTASTVLSTSESTSQVVWFTIGAAVIALLALWYLCYSMYSAVGFYIRFGLTALRTDLADIQGHYNLCQVESEPDERPEDLGDSELRPTSIKGLWVAEIVSPVTKKSEIVGCISLNDPPPPPFTSESAFPELCRMVVSHNHRRRGIAGALIRACEMHAMENEHKSSAIVLRTTFYQPHARHLYANFGYKIMMEKSLHFGNAVIPVFLYRKDLSSKKMK